MKTDFVLDAIKNSIYARQLERNSGPIHYSDCGSQTCGSTITSDLQRPAPTLRQTARAAVTIVL